jgi:transposase-like protein
LRGKVHTLIVPDTKTATLAPLIRQPVKPESIAYTDGYTSYDLLDVSEFNHTGSTIRKNSLWTAPITSHDGWIDDIHHQQHKRY